MAWQGCGPKRQEAKALCAEFEAFRLCGKARFKEGLVRSTPTRRMEYNQVLKVTCTIATWRRVPRRPTAMEAAAITAGPVRNRTAMENAATELPHAIIFGWRAINSPVRKTYPLIITTQRHPMPNHKNRDRKQRESPQKSKSITRVHESHVRINNQRPVSHLFDDNRRWGHLFSVGNLQELKLEVDSECPWNGMDVRKGAKTVASKAIKGLQAYFWYFSGQIAVQFHHLRHGCSPIPRLTYS
ncbi:hypothetical protein ACLOJK_032398 [Asimina triloba]